MLKEEISKRFRFWDILFPFLCGPEVYFLTEDFGLTGLAFNCLISVSNF